MIIADEIFSAVDVGFITTTDVINLIENALTQQSLYLQVTT